MFRELELSSVIKACLQRSEHLRLGRGLGFLLCCLIVVSGCTREPGADFTLEGTTTNNTLIPQPLALTEQQGSVSIAEGVAVDLSQCQSESVQDQLLAWRDLIAVQFGRNIDFLFGSSPGEFPDLIQLTVHCDNIVFAVDTTSSESYQLEVLPNNLVNIQSPTQLGSLHAVTTLSQWLTEDLLLPAVIIEDSPKFPWRGVMIDVARHFIPKSDLLRQIDAMAMVKLNVLHLHLSDDQGFRVESRVFPLLHELGSEGEFYSQADITEIVQYASKKGIRVVPEFDIPGHSTSWLVGYPQLGSKEGPFELRRRFAISDNALNPASEEVFQFLDTLFIEMGNLFPDAYFHIGGDEVNDVQWRNNEEIQAFMQELGLTSSHDLQIYFINRVVELLQAQGKRVIGWREVLDDNLDPSVVVQNWDTFPPVRNNWSIFNIMEAGHSAIQSGGYYLDHQLTAAQHYQYSIAGKPELPDTGTSFFGAEAAVWTEFIDNSNLDYRLWPRTGAIAERLWSYQTTGIGDLYRRLNNLDELLTAKGMTHRWDYSHRVQEWAGEDYVPELTSLVDALSPLQLWRHFSILWSTTDRPLNRLADITDVDNPEIIKLHGDINRLLAGEDPWTQLENVRGYFEKLNHDYLSVRPLLRESSGLSELQGPAKDVNRLAVLALEALQAAESKQPFSLSPEQTFSVNFDLLWRLEEVDVEFRPLVKKLTSSVTVIQQQLHGDS